MQVNVDKYYALLGKLRAIIAIIVALLLVLTFFYLIVSKNWVQDRNYKGEAAFLKGAIGTEVMPMVVFEVLPDLFPENFQPEGPEAGDWIDQYGFIRNPDNDTLPIGFTLSNRRPKSGTPSPVPFVALTCALCHSTEIEPVGTNERHFILGPGNRSLNLFSWLDAFQSSVSDEEKLNVKSIKKAYFEKYGRRLSYSEILMTRLWLKGMRKTLEEGLMNHLVTENLGIQKLLHLVLHAPFRSEQLSETHLTDQVKKWLYILKFLLSICKRIGNGLK